MVSHSTNGNTSPQEAITHFVPPPDASQSTKASFAYNSSDNNSRDNVRTATKKPKPLVSFAGGASCLLNTINPTPSSSSWVIMVVCADDNCVF